MIVIKAESLAHAHLLLSLYPEIKVVFFDNEIKKSYGHYYSVPTNLEPTITLEEYLESITHK